MAGGALWYLATIPISVLLRGPNPIFLGLQGVGFAMGVAMIFLFGPGAVRGVVHERGFSLDFARGRVFSQGWTDGRLRMSLAEVNVRGTVTYELRARRLRFPNMTNVSGDFYLDLLREGRRQGLDIRSRSVDSLGTKVLVNEVAPASKRQAGQGIGR